ncbi:LysM peptidoglycan-binding domain-containing protein [Sutcliffiella sp. NC1]|uniref:LysM peptidoglycan-binding domain-containing protein n=1 Tax=Sutcliffiella sp. NC1 TaxID=3004096 RepID=UPI0022DE965C|nr:LysM peptidoglycan-binding domain-containing protein [Sutcliffiella sp. NC1]WBL16762.1 LysM peptidoglycan-binding domain-containing protein [Sutcliffiella sp. NC1]
MNLKHYKLQQLNTDEYALVLYLDDQLTEFANELGTDVQSQQSIRLTAIKIIKEKYPAMKVTAIKVIVGGLLATSIPLLDNKHSASAQTNEPNGQATDSSAVHYIVAPGDTLWTIARKFGTTIDYIKRGNNLTSDILHVNQQLIIPIAFHKVEVGDYLSVLARDYKTTISAIREANGLTNDSVRLGQTLIIPAIVSVSKSQPTQVIPPAQQSKTYTVVSGDSLSVIAKKFGITTESLRSANNLTSDIIRVGQTLTIPGSDNSPSEQSTDLNYTVVSGDSLSVIAKRFGTTTEALRTSNNLSSDVLQIGQRLVVPTGNSTISAPTPVPLQPTTYTVISGDSLSVIAKRFNITTDSLRSANNLRTDVLQIGQTLTIPSSGTTTTPTTPAPTVSSYTVISGDSLSVIAKRFNTTADALRSENNLRSDVLQIGQVLTIPSGSTGTSQPTPTQTVQEERKTFTYRVVAGDSLSVIANRFGVTVPAIRSANNLKSDILQVGQALTIPDGINAPAQTAANTITYITHTVKSGDNLWDLSIRYGIPQTELLRANNLTTRSTLSIGQKLTIPVHNIAVKPVVSAKHGELLDWWTEAQYVFPIGKEATVTDMKTGKSFKIKRTIGANHADAETLTTRDSNIAKEIWGGFSWTPRAVIVEVDGRKLAASMSFMPHDVQYITKNGITGHFDVYFSNSTRHVDGKADPKHQAQVEIAAGLR